MSTILVTGGLGVIGAWVTRQLIEEGHEVVTCSRHVESLDLIHSITWKQE